MLSLHTLWELTCIKEAEKAQNNGQADTVKIAVQLEELEQEKQQSKQIQHFGRLVKGHEAYDCISCAGNEKTNKQSMN